jgi:membrane protein required for beta-lactamase induction
MIDAIQNDFAMWKQASQVRKLCEGKETKLKNVRNIWIGLVLFTVIAFNAIKLLLPKISAITFEFSGLLTINPIIKWAIAGFVTMIILAALIFCIRYNSAASKTELARKNEWHSLLLTYKSFYQK